MLTAAVLRDLWTLPVHSEQELTLKNAERETAIKNQSQNCTQKKPRRDFKETALVV